MKVDLFTDEVYVFTPKGDLLNFPEGATVIDFAYRIHSEVGHHCTGARVNGRLVPLRYQLQSGDTVEIITTPQPDADEGLAEARQDAARQGARSGPGSRTSSATRSVAVGREILERDLARYQPRPRRAPAGRDARARRARARAQGRGGAARGRRLRQADGAAGARAHRCRRGARQTPARAARRARSQQLFRLVAAAAADGRRPRLRRRRRAGALRRVLQSAARASASPASSRAAAASPCTRSTARRCWRATRSAASTSRGRTATARAAPVSVEVDVRRRARPARRDVQGDQLDRRQHRTRPGARTGMTSKAHEHVRADGADGATS